LRDCRFDFAARRGELASDAILAGGNPSRGRNPSLFYYRSAFIEQLLSRGFLLGIHLRASVLQGVLVLLILLSGGSLGQLSSFLRTYCAGLALGHNFKQRLKEKRPQNEVKKKDDQDCRHSLKEEFYQLVNHFLH